MCIYFNLVLAHLSCIDTPYIKDSGYFLKKIENTGKIPEWVIFATADVVRLYHSISHGVGLEALQKRLSERDL